MPITPERVSEITDEASLFAFLREELKWPLTETPALYDFYADELGLTEEAEGKIGRVTQIANFEAGQPWGLFLVEFQGEHLYKSALRRVLRGLSETRKDRDASMPAWAASNLLFICTCGYKEFAFARFDGTTHTRAILSIFGWQQGDTALRTLCEYNPKTLVYPADSGDAAGWLKKWAAAWSVEAVTASFYNDYDRVFKEVEPLVHGVKGDKRLFTQRLFNRLMFLQFLSKKRWLRFQGRTDYLFALWEGRDKKHSFYTNHVTQLFFAGLNTQTGANVRSPALQALIGDVPYLNGGLFEKDEGDEDGETVEDTAFEKIFGLFAKYNFTVHESTPLDVEVAVDPEMLGKVFEKLMTGRRGKGAYYTPRSIVTFMCRESLKGFLAKTPSDTPETPIPEERISRLIDSGDDTAVSLAEAKRLLARLAKLKVVDPACGSGAYLLGMMQEVFLLTRLLDTRSENAQARDDYERKLGIIQNNLYGVDLDEFAVNIAMLRLWLSLIVDYREDEIRRLLPLPNLDFKIECGDSLSAPDPQKISDLFRDVLITQADALQKLKARFFRESGTRKADLKREIERKEAELEKELNESSLPVDSFEWRVKFAEVFKPEIADVTIGNALNFGQELAEADVPGGFHIVIANPPYGVKVEDALRLKYFDRATEGSQSKDTYGLFMARALQLLCEGGQFSYIVSDTWRTIKSHRPLRARLLQQSAVRHVIDLPDWVFEATVNTGIVTLEKTKPAKDHKLTAGDLRGLERFDWFGLESNLRIIAAHGVDVQTPLYARYTYPQSLIASYDNLSFFIASPKLYGLMSDPRFVRLETIAEVKQGLATADNEFYLRKRAGVRGGYELLDVAKLLTEEDIAGLSSSEKLNGVDPEKRSGRCFVPYDKGGESDAEGGWLPNYYVPTGYFIDWSVEAVSRLRTATIADVKRRKGELDEIKDSDENTRAAVIRNPQFYFRLGLTFSRTGVYAPTFRVGCNACFDSKSDGLFADTYDHEVLLGLLASILARFFMKSYLCHTVQAEGDALLGMPIPAFNTDSEQQTRALVHSIIGKQKAEPRYPYYLNEQKEIDALVYQLYGLDDESDIREVEFWFCRRYPLLAKAQGVWQEVETKYASYLQRAAFLLSKPPGYWHSHHIYTMIARKEDHTLDFKRYLAVDLNGAPSSASSESVLKEIAGFLNADGGTMLIGVTDIGEVIGIGRDLPHVTHKNEDGFELKLRQFLETRLSPPPLGLVQIGFEVLPEGVVCVVEVAPALGVTYFNNKIYLRDGNHSIPLEGRALVEWIQRRKI